MKKSTVVVLAVSGAGLAVVTLVGVVAGLLFLGANGLSSRAPTAEEKELVVPIERLARIGAEVRVPETAESYTAKRNLDLSLEIEYEYDSSKAPKSADFLFFKSEAEINGSEQEARESFSMAIQATRLGVSLVKERALEPEEAPLELGDHAYWATIRQAGAPVGNFVVVRRGRIVHTLLVLGFYFNEPDQAETLLAPAIEKSSAWK